ncbi:MAG: hypothetical protein ACLQNG_04785 [Acidimicrobiales bacterium]|jgi:hypothetical protein
MITPNRALSRGRRPVAGVLALAVVLGGFGLTGCGIIKAAKKIVHGVEQNRATMDAFTNKIQSGPTTFEATYVTTGSSPATVVYAVQPPNGAMLSDTPTGAGTSPAGTSTGPFQFIVNPSGEYACTHPSGSSPKWSCEMLPKTSAADYENILNFYTPTHWVTFLKDFALAAGFAGDKVSSSSLSVNGFNMSCVDFVATGEPGTSLICTTAQNILGYVKVAGDSTSFQIKSYSTAPSSSLFQLPPGATVTTIPIPSSTTTTTS